MKKTLSSANDVNNSNGLQVVDVKDNATTKAKVQKPNVLEDSANSLDDVENLKKSETFAKVKDLFGFSKFDKEAKAKSLAMDLANGVITFAEFQAQMAAANKAVNSENESLENLSFEKICKTIQDSELIQDVAKYMGTSDLLSLKSLIVSGKDVILYHGSQSEEGEKFETMKVTIKGKHKPYIDTCYFSKAPLTTSNILRAFRAYGYYLKSLNRCKKQRKEETALFDRFLQIKERLHKEFGYMPEDFANL